MCRLLFGECEKRRYCTINLSRHLPNCVKTRIMPRFINEVQAKPLRPLFKEIQNETRYSSDLPRSERDLLLRQQIHHAIFYGKRKLQHRGLLRMPSVLYRQTKNRGYRWSRGQIQPKIRQYVQTFRLIRYCPNIRSCFGADFF